MQNDGPSLVFWSYPLPRGVLLSETLGWVGLGEAKAHVSAQEVKITELSLFANDW